MVPGRAAGVPEYGVDTGGAAGGAGVGVGAGGGAGAGDVPFVAAFSVVKFTPISVPSSRSLAHFERQA